MVYFTEKENRCVVECDHCAGEGVMIAIDKEDDGGYFYQLIMDSKWNMEQNGFFWKLKKIWAVIRNKDYYYSEICLSKEEFTKFRDWLNKF